MGTRAQQTIIERILDERARQDHLRAEGKFPFTCADARVDDIRKMPILVEEVGEVGRALNEYEVTRSKIHTIDQRVAYASIDAREDLRRELIQVAAVCVAWLEAL